MCSSGVSSLWSGARTVLGISAFAWIGVPMSMSSVCAETRPSGSDSSKKQPLQELLIAEAHGTAVDRAAALEDLRSATPERDRSPSQQTMADAIHWHSGELAHSEGWRPVADLNPETLDPAVAKYYQMRGDQALDIDGHRTLARWCKSKGLGSQARAHWFGVLQHDGSDMEARQALGFSFVGSRWFSREEMSAVSERSKTAVDSLKQWMPRVREWVAAIDGNDAKKRLKAIQQLKAIQDPKAVAALDAAVWQVGSDAALHFIHAISRFQTREACISLAGIAIADPTSETGVAAIEALRGYPLDVYVPDMLDLMCTEYELKDQMVTRSNGEMVLQLVQMRELRNRFEIGQMDKIMMIDRSGQGPRLAANRPDWRVIPSEFLLVTPRAVSNDVAKSIVQEESKRLTAEAQAAVDQDNMSIRMFQRRIATVLRAVSGQKLDDRPKSWWDWWERYEESYEVGPKFQDQRYSEDRSETIYEAEEVCSVSYNDREFAAGLPSNATLVPASSLPRGRLECLVAGTQIQTDQGLRSVESIRVGDHVVSQDIASGELRLRPVIRTTLRPPAPTREMTLADGETIRSTLGHPWWVIGSGWVKTKDLKQGMAIRTSTGFAVLQSLSDAEAVETFNLVVDDDHTYFVGRSRLLSFDASDPSPTFQRTPGLPAERLRNRD